MSTGFHAYIPLRYYSDHHLQIYSNLLFLKPLPIKIRKCLFTDTVSVHNILITDRVAAHNILFTDSMKTINHSATIGIFISESADFSLVSLHDILFTDSMKIVHYSLTRGMTHKKLF